GLSFLDYEKTKTDFGLVCTSPLLSGAKIDVNAQTVISAGDKATGGYDIKYGGCDPWHETADSDYLIGLLKQQPHTVTDSASSATSMASGIKTYNAAIGVAVDGTHTYSIARELQQQRQFKIGIVTSVPVSHATPGAVYANNVTRKDYQDISRDLIGLPSSSHRRNPLPGVDVLIGGGWGQKKETDELQGDNFMQGNPYLHDEDLKKADVRNGGRYLISQRTPGKSGRKNLLADARKAAKQGHRLLGFYGAVAGHLPFQTADGGFNPTVDIKGTEKYSAADIAENPNLADMTEATLLTLENADKGFWLLIEAGDVDWANHSNNIDNSIGAVLSGAAAFKTLTRWIEKHDAWDETAVIVTSDHGHYLVIQDDNVIANAGREMNQRKSTTKKQVDVKNRSK
ncbi:MAG: alkaline phosphatase, partial [Pirellulaceae bacterium]|nr:alkaline phosphatase [Pirellulaceae bacterium]